MKLIKSVEIGYFRSIYKESIDCDSDLNIVFGRNDSGKSNVLRALNLFFNGQTNPGKVFDFAMDLCQARRVEASGKRDARKFVYIKLTFNSPSGWTKSLGSTFYVKKIWSLQKQVEPGIEISIRDQSKKQYLTRFLNKIKFHYVPAIKDRRIFEELLRNVYKVVADNGELTNSLLPFSDAVKTATNSLSSSVKTALNISSIISPPTDLTDLFKSLDFEIADETGDKYSLTLQRGDGVQVRHIPEILSFLSKNLSEDYHIWGFEEPENSLELINVIQESKSFIRYSQEPNIQVFLTSHSPAFFNLEHANVSRFFTKRELYEETKREVTKVVKITQDYAPHELMGELPYLSVFSSYLAKAEATVKEYEESIAYLKREIESSKIPTLFVEGTSDEIVFRKAWEIKYGHIALNIVSCGGTDNMSALSKPGQVLSSISKSDYVFALVDNDAAGREIYKNKKLKPEGGHWVRETRNGVYWCRLAVHDEFKEAMRHFNIPENAWPLTLENSYSIETIEQAIQAGAYNINDEPCTEIYEPQNKLINKFIMAKIQGNKYLPYLSSANKDKKIAFADWVSERADYEPNILKNVYVALDSLYEKLVSLCDELIDDHVI
ncbi:AAA family ATPase [Aeromonas dhakensis]|uniref:ATP-dependent nuclease n=1 Tax=Aeromonas dhakensis TaxID=196024 RepID=UPI00227BA7AB|nr:AAA family ATPase [Aeromonas dhakensis]WAF68222.1 ATP-binding protein [Aeromonas dhakensis]